VMITGVRASASRPTSTLRRVISKAFDRVRKLSPLKLKMAHSNNNTTTRIHSRLGNARRCHGAISFKSGANCVFEFNAQVSVRKSILAPGRESSHYNVGNNGREYDRSLNCLFPKRVDTDKCQRWTNRSQQSNPN